MLALLFALALAHGALPALDEADTLPHDPAKKLITNSL